MKRFNAKKGARIVLLGLCGLLIMAGAAPGKLFAQSRSLSVVASEAKPELELLYTIGDGQEEEHTAEFGLKLSPEEPMIAILRLTWRGGPDLIGSATLVEPPTLKNVFPAVEGGEWEPAHSYDSATSDSPISYAWKLALAPGEPGPAEIGRGTIEIAFEGFEDRPALEYRSKALAWEWRGASFPWLAVLGLLVGAGLIGAGGYIAVTKGPEALATLKQKRADRPRIEAKPKAPKPPKPPKAPKAPKPPKPPKPAPEPPAFNADDPTPYEQAHAELATCETKAKTGDIEGFIRKFRPIIYNFAAVTEGPGVRTLNSEELARHLDEVNYNERMAQLLVHGLKMCERYDATGQEPPHALCIKMAGEMRDAALQAKRRAPRKV